MTDEPMQDYGLARRAMVDSQLRPLAVTHAGVLAAMAAVPRERFVPPTARAFAYFDRSIPLGDGRALMAPAALGRLLTELDPLPRERALIVASTGYAAAVLRAIGLEVVEADAATATGAGFDLILIEGAVEYVPPQLAALLAPNGRLGCAIVDRGVTRLAVGSASADSIAFRTIIDADVPRLSGFERPVAFTF